MTLIYKLHSRNSLPISKIKPSDSVLIPLYPPYIRSLCPGKVTAVCQLRGDGGAPVVVGCVYSTSAVGSIYINNPYVHPAQNIKC